MRDPDHPSHPETPLYKGFPGDLVRDDRFFVIVRKAAIKREQNEARFDFAEREESQRS